MNIKQLKETVDALFRDRTSFVSLLQEIAQNFYPERADFTVQRSLGSKYAEDLMTSYPIITRRELGNQIGVMLRPTDKEWFKMVPSDQERIDHEAKRWLEWAGKNMKRAMYDRRTLFTKTMKESDHDFATFGQAVISCRLNKNFDGLLYRNWHLRDVVWTENDEGQISLVARKWKPYARELVATFPNAHQKMIERAQKEPFSRTDVLHIVCESDMYNDNNLGRPYWSIYYDCENSHILEAVPVWFNEYIIPRWQTVSGSQYAFSPATITALPDARLIQSMAYTILEAGEKAVNPPVVATEDVVRSDVAIYAGGITWVDMEYDEKLGQALRPLQQDLRGLPFGQEMMQDSRALIHEAFYLNKLNLPERSPEMTAYEVGQRVQEYIRGALPIFEPMEMDYNGGICEATFEILMRAGAFGSAHNIPKSLQGQDVNFIFQSPLHDAIEQQKGQKFAEAGEMIRQAMELDQGTIYNVDISTAMRDAMEGVGIPQKWIRSEREVQDAQNDAAQQKEQQMMLESLQQGGDAANSVGQAVKTMDEAVAG